MRNAWGAWDGVPVLRQHQRGCSRQAHRGADRIQDRRPVLKDGGRGRKWDARAADWGRPVRLDPKDAAASRDRSTADNWPTVAALPDAAAVAAPCRQGADRSAA